MTAEALAPHAQRRRRPSPLLSLRGIQKSFGAVHVLRGVDLDVRRGQVTALVGDNGAGKSTLIKGIAGIHALRRGRVPLRGPARHRARPPGRQRARDRGRLPGPRAVRQPRRGPEHVPRPRARQRRGARRGRHGGPRPRDPRRPLGAHAPVGAHRPSPRSPVASGRPSRSPARCSGTPSSSILDEPTAALGVAQTEQVLRLVRRLADNGLGVILISHNLNDVFEVADDIAVLYLGIDGGPGATRRRHLQPGGRADHHRPLRRHGSQRRGRRAGGGGPVTHPTAPQHRPHATTEPARASAPRSVGRRPRRHRPRLRHQAPRRRPRAPCRPSSA